jgi:hypothetical protein
MGPGGEILTEVEDAWKDMPSRCAGDGREVIGIGEYQDGETTSPLRGVGPGLSRQGGAGKMAAILGGYR